MRSFALACAGALALSLIGSPVSAVSSQTFNYTGSFQSYTVPVGVTAIDVAVHGAQGAGASGGRGATVAATLSVIPGSVLQIMVGGRGTDRGGWNGGGDPGVVDGGKANQNLGGGGASDIRSGTCAASGSCGLNDRVIIAGGGGGGDQASAQAGDPAGGVGGTPAGGDGGDGWATGGHGATQSAGGTGGPGYEGSGDGNDGELGIGGSGGSHGSLLAACAGAGGGGGYYGGGGGGADSPTCSTGGAGGGGSSYVDPSVTSGASYAADALGDGSVTISPVSADGPVVSSQVVSSVAGHSAVFSFAANAAGSSFDATVHYAAHAADAGISIPAGSLTGSEDQTRSTTINGLNSGQSYWVWVELRSSNTTVVSSQASFTTADVPSRPSAPVAIPAQQRGSALVRWIAPAVNGAAIESYRVIVDGSSQGCVVAVSARECVVSGLTGAESFRFAVIATNSVGASTASPWSVLVNPRLRGVPIHFRDLPSELAAGRPVKLKASVNEALSGVVRLEVGASHCSARLANGLAKCSLTPRGGSTQAAYAFFTGDGDDQGATAATLARLSVSKVAITATRRVCSRSRHQILARITGQSTKAKASISIQLKSLRGWKTVAHTRSKHGKWAAKVHVAQGVHRWRAVTASAYSLVFVQKIKKCR